MVAFLLLLLIRTCKWFFFPSLKGIPGIPVNFQPPIGTKKQVPQFLAPASLLVGVPPAGFKLKHFPIIIHKEGCLHIGRFLSSFIMTVGLHIPIDPFTRGTFIGFGFILPESK